MRTRSSTAKRLLKFIAGVSALTLLAAPTVFGATTSKDPQFSKSFLNYSSQAPQAWTNTIPNALASYYTYIPLSNADALALGFPSACGNPNAASNPFTHTVYHTPGSGDLTSTADCYIISVRQFKQPTSLDFLKYVLPEFPIPPAFQSPTDPTVGANLFPGAGLLNATGTPFVDTTGNVLAFAGSNAANGTRAYGYGSGGQNWNPYYVSPANPGPTIRGCAPWAFQTTPFNFAFGPGQNGDPNATGVWHFPAPTIKGTSNRPVYVQWLNDLPNTPPVNHDPTVDCGANAPNCYPYNRHVVHVHGAHVFPESDGLATAWYTPNFGTGIDGAVGEGTALFTGANTYAHTPLNPTPIYYYPLTQEAGTIWYHDHAIGTTHLNTDMGMAGFFPVTDAQETALRTAGTLPSGDTYELGFALQDRNFDTTAQMIMPDYAIYDKSNLACTYLDAPGNLIPNPSNPNCVRQPFLKLADNSTQGWHFVPLAGNEALLGNALNPTTGCVNNANQPFPKAGECAPFGATSASLEYFGNIPVVNGVTYGSYPVAPGVYRMRFIGGTDSRTWILQLQTSTGTVIPFWQIGSEQGLFNAPVQRTILDLMGGERFDVLVDFNQIAPLGGRVFLKDLGEDAPYAGGLITDGVAAYVPPNASSIPDVMVFDVAAGAVNYNSPAPGSIVTLRPTTPLPALVTPEYTRTIALVEITDVFGRTMPTIDTRGYRPAEMPISENILQNQIEQWDIVNTTVDAHPMHLHQVAFQLIDRQAMNAFLAPVTNLGDANFQPAYPFMDGIDYTVVPTAAETILSPAQYAPTGPVIAPLPWEVLSMKDTVDCPPSYVTRILTKFDILGTYVWHCHILSHEEHDMMRPFRVVAAKLAAPASISAPAFAPVTGVVNVIVAPTATAPSGPVPYKYLVQFKKTTDTFWTTSPTNVNNPAINLTPYGLGTYQFRAQVVNQLLQDQATTNLADSNWVTGGSTVFDGILRPPVQTAPAGFIGNVPSPIYTWTEVIGATSYSLHVSNSVGSGVVHLTGIPASSCVASVCTATGSALPAGTFSWSVQAVNATQSSKWSTAIGFTIDKNVAKIAPTGVVATNSPTYRWTPLAGSTSYNLHVSNVATGAGAIHVIGVAATCSATECTATASSLPAGTYGWTVQSVGSGGAGPWGTAMPFTIPAAPGAVTKIAPAGNIGAIRSPTYRWNEIPGATSYNLHVTNVTTGAGAIHQIGVAASCITGVCTATAGNLQAGTYSWTVQAVNAMGTGPWGTAMPFFTTP